MTDSTPVVQSFTKIQSPLRAFTDLVVSNYVEMRDVSISAVFYIYFSPRHYDNIIKFSIKMIWLKVKTVYIYVRYGLMKYIYFWKVSMTLNNPFDCVSHAGITRLTRTLFSYKLSRAYFQI